MHIAAAWGARERFADSVQLLPRTLLKGQRVLIAVIAIVTWLALVGGILSEYILEGAGVHTHSVTLYAAYDLLQPAPTSFGTLRVSRAGLVPVDDGVKVDVTLLVNNTTNAQADAPRLEDMRLITSDGTDVNLQRPAGWNGPAVLPAFSSNTIDLEYKAPINAGLLWLEYNDLYGQWPLRMTLGNTPLEPQP